MIKRLLFALLVLISLSTLLSSSEIIYEGKMGYLIDGLNDVKYKDARIALDLWISGLAVDEGIETKINYYEEVEPILEDYKNFKIDYLTMNPYYILKYQDIVLRNTKEFWAIKKSKDTFEAYVLLVRADAKITSVKELKNKRCMRRNDDYIAQLILDYEVLKQAHTMAVNHLESIDLTKNFSRAILQTYFGKADACIVPVYALDIVSEMNPDILKKLKPLYVSEKIFIPVMAGFHRKTDARLIKSFKRSVKALESTVRGENILNLFKMKELIVVQREALDPMLNYYSGYLQMKKNIK